MKSIVHNVTVLASIGWYLMLPKSLTHGMPLQQWNQAQSFDSAAVCEDWKVKQIQSLINHEVPGITAESEKQNEGIYATGLCIASDDPRLAK